MSDWSPVQLRQQHAVLEALGPGWRTAGEVRARVGGRLPGRVVQYRLRELRTRGKVEYREDPLTRTGHWRRADA